MVFDGSPYEDFVKVVAIFRPVKVVVVMPTDDRHKASHFCKLMAEVGFTEKVIALEKTLGFAALDNEEYLYKQEKKTGNLVGSKETSKREDWTHLYPGLIEYNFYVHIFS